MEPNALRLIIVTGTDIDRNDHFVTPPLTLNVKTTVTIIALNNVVTVRFNGAVVASKTVAGKRFFGTATLYTSNPWHPAANAIFGAYSLTKA
jgi:hypothetical protein